MKRLKLSKKKRIAFITSSRSDFYLLKNLINLFRKDKKFEEYIVITGNHFLKDFGYTFKDILKNKFNRVVKLNTFKLKSDSKGISDNFYKTSKYFSDFLNRRKIDLIILLGDRYEILSIAAISSLYSIPIAHLHGGEITYGSQDDNYRHAITKLSHLHFVSTNKAKKRIFQLGEGKKEVFNVGSFGIDRIRNIKLYSKFEIEKKLKIKLKNQNFLINFHPSTFLSKKNVIEIKEILKALKYFKNTILIFTYPNADKFNSLIITELKKFTKKNNNCYLFNSLGDKKYFSLIKYVDLVIGNSSSGILEVPYFKKPSINLGDRQLGREQPASVINSKIKKNLIIKNIKLGLSNSFKKKIKKFYNPYLKKNTALKTYNIISKYNLKKFNYKKFHDFK